MEIRPTRMDELPELSAFLTGQGMARSPEMLRWKLWAAPGAPSSASRSLIARIDGRMVGHIGIMPTAVHVDASGSGAIDGGWFVDWMVDRNLRSRGIGVFLLREAAALCRSLMTIQGSAETRQALPQLHWSENRHLGVFKLNTAAGATNGTGIIAGAARELARLLYYHPVRYRPPAGWRLIEPAEKDDGDPWALLDAALARSEHGVNGSLCYCRRSGAFLRWSFGDHPRGRYRLSIVCDKVGPLGYAIWRTLPRPDGRLEGRIVDAGLPWDHAEGWRWLISAVTARLAAEGAVQVTCLSGTDSPLARALIANRFVLRQPLPLWVSPGASELGRERRWHLTYADSDIDTGAD